MSFVLFEIAADGLVLAESAVVALSGSNGNVNVFLTMSSISDIKHDENSISCELIGSATSTCLSCVVDLTPMTGRSGLSNLLPAMCNLLSLASALFIQLDVDDINKNVEQLSFLNEILEHFDNNMSLLQRSVTVPVVRLCAKGPASAAAGAGAGASSGVVKGSKKSAAEKLLLPEKGFSEEIGRRNCTRNILSSLSPQQVVVLPLPGLEGAWAAHPSALDSMAQTPPKRVQCLDLSGPLLVNYLRALQQASVAGRVLGAEDLSALVAPVLGQAEEAALRHFTQGAGGGVAGLPPAVAMRRRAEALALHEAVIAAPSARSTASRKHLQGRLRQAMQVYRTARLAGLRQRCEERLAALATSHFSPEHRELTSHHMLALELGEGGNVYSQFLTFKNSLEKIVNMFLALDIAELLCEGETETETEQGQGGEKGEKGEEKGALEEAVSFYLVLEAGEAAGLKHAVLYDFIITRLRHILQMGDSWVKAYESLAAGAAGKMKTLKADTARVQSELEALIETAVRGKEAAGEVIVGLMDSFEAARDDQSKQLHDKQSELDRLVSGLDRTTKLNETDKEELTNELMKVQEKIQEAQKQSLALRQERETQTSALHSDLLEEERKGHRWFRSTIARQHALLSEELALERKVNETKSQQMAQVFALESEHIRSLEKIRSAAQEQRQVFRDDMFRQREQVSQEHDALMAALRQRNMDLDSKLSAANFNNTVANKQEGDKGCVVM